MERNMLVLVITKLLLDRDIIETGEMTARARPGEWAMGYAGWGWGDAGTCAGCQRPLMPSKQLGVGGGSAYAIAAAGVGEFR